MLDAGSCATNRIAILPRKRDSLTAENSDKDYRFNTALARGLSVLGAFGPDNRPIGNAEIAQRVNLPKATVSRMTFTLTELGYLNYNEDIGRYTLGPGVLTLGYDVMAKMEIRDIARPYMRELADYADASVYLGVPNGLEIIYVEACRAPATMAIRLGVGSRVPLAVTGMGRAYLSALPHVERQELIARLSETEQDWEELLPRLEKALKEAEERGFALSDGDWIPEANSAAAAICRKDGHPAYVVNVGGLRSIVTSERLTEDLGPRVLEMAKQIEHLARGML